MERVIAVNIIESNMVIEYIQSQKVFTYWGFPVGEQCNGKFQFQLKLQLAERTRSVLRQWVSVEVAGHCRLGRCGYIGGESEINIATAAGVLCLSQWLTEWLLVCTRTCCRCTSSPQQGPRTATRRSRLLACMAYAPDDVCLVAVGVACITVGDNRSSFTYITRRYFHHCCLT